MADSQGTRRRPVDLRELIVAAAAREFATNGFQQTTVRAIADAAGVSSSVMHRHFPSKERLFSEAVMAPFLEFYESFMSAWVEHVAELKDPWGRDDLTREFVARLYVALKGQRNTLVGLMAINESSTDVVGEIQAAVAEMRLKLKAVAEREARKRGVDPDVATTANRMMAALVTGVVLLQPLFGTDDDDQSLIDAAARAALHGVWEP